MSSTSTLPVSVSSSQAVFSNLSMASNNLFSNSLRFTCCCLAQTHSFSNTSTCSLYTATCQAMSHCLSWASNNFLSSYGFTYASLAQIHNISNAAMLPVCAAQYHAVLPSSFLASNNLLFNSSGLSCNSLA